MINMYSQPTYSYILKNIYQAKQEKHEKEENEY
jgi:hypothetical protein